MPKSRPKGAAITFGALLRAKRAAHGVTLARLGQVLGVSVPYLSDVENSRRKPLRRELIEKTAELFDDVDSLLMAAAIERGTVCPHCGKGLVL